MENKNKVISIVDFFVNTPPGKIEDVECSLIQSYSNKQRIVLPSLELHCDDKKCNGKRFFSSSSEVSLAYESEDNFFIKYVCKNCNSYFKIYSVYIQLKNHSLCSVYKYGEVPPFGPPLPSKLFSIIGPDKQLFLIGRRAENQGMGIGSFAYYRRVVENQRDRIFDEIIKALKKNSSSPELIEELENAKKETQFSKSLQSIKSAFPESLLISNHNPLTLLHSALSEGLHSKDENECLEMANSIRLILTELAERISNILKEQSILHS
jgi:hypothetical protein